MYNNYIWFGDHVQGNTPTSTTPSGILIQSDNAFLSDQVRTALANAGQTSFYMGRFNSDLSYPEIDFERKVTQGTLAFDGKIGRICAGAPITAMASIRTTSIPPASCWPANSPTRWIR
ncbi:hypothetical protein DdX_21997 [Ditylenchus destructor]|uniref:Uncharacterized protein n=1 Tax=Ditylenchus destructor TaxID=166010 RepID=A0AAD4MEU6_9BILA|nr:hypothetical protein DdX_21997 [Ditylenchus destructor]